jgi:mRNA interferase RelE/StbE
LITCSYKKTFLADLLSIDVKTRERIEKLVFEKIPGLEASSSLFGTHNVKAMRGYPSYFRIRFGHYRIGFRLEGDRALTFYRVKHRKDIYRVFPG